MSIPIALRVDFDAGALRRVAKATKDVAQGRRLLAWPRFTTAARGRMRPGSAELGCRPSGIGCCFNADGPEGLIDGKAPGNPSKLNDEQRPALARIIESGPIPAIHGVVRWRLRDLAWWVFEEFRISLDETTVSREVRKLRLPQPVGTAAALCAERARHGGF